VNYWGYYLLFYSLSSNLSRRKPRGSADQNLPRFPVEDGPAHEGSAEFLHENSENRTGFPRAQFPADG
jgi:hypothetical protein